MCPHCLHEFNRSRVDESERGLSWVSHLVFPEIPCFFSLTSSSVYVCWGQREGGGREREREREREGEGEREISGRRSSALLKIPVPTH